MNVFDKEDLHAPMVEINTTPLVDVMLVLMVIFLITAPILEKSINVQLPNDAGTAVHEQKDTITIVVTKNGEYYFGETLIVPDKLQESLINLRNQNPSRSIAIKADASAMHEDVVMLLGEVSRTGFKSVNFITQKK